ncbi:MAG: hypothetical protein AB7D37_12230 [Desulfovibrio sp.]
MRFAIKAGVLCLLCCVALMSLLSRAALADEEEDLGKTGAELANPLGNLWALNMSFGLPQFYDGNIVSGAPHTGTSMLFQPVMPVPLYGEGEAALRLITRPIIPVSFSQPIPKRGEFQNIGGIGDIQVPLLLAAPDSMSGNFILGAGPVGMLPTATDYRLGKGQWAMGPAAVFGYKNRLLTVGVFPNYFWKIGSSSQGDRTPDISQGSMFYFLVFNLPKAWQIGMNPTITYDNQATEGNRWNVPVGLFVGKTVKIGRTPVNIKVGFEYSVVSQKDYGQQAQIRIQITPVIESLIKNPVFGK